MNFADYQAIPAENFSCIKHILISPKHYQAARLTEKEDTIDMRLGTACHRFILEGTVIPYEVRPEFDPDKPAEKWQGNRNSCKAWLADRKARGIVVYAPDEVQRQTRMFSALQNSELLAELLAACPEREKTVQAEFMGLPMKARLDAAGHWEGRRLIMDLKKTPDASPRGWGRKAYQFHYDMQIAAYSNLLAMQEDLSQPPMVVHAVVEDSDAAPVCLYRVPDEMWTSGQAKLARAVSLLKTCRAADYWPGYGEEGLLSPIWPRYAADNYQPAPDQNS